MGSDGNGNPGLSAAEAIELCESYRALHDMRIDIDNRLMALPADDEARDSLWQELETVIGRLSELATRLAATPAPEASVVRAKASVLSLILGSGDSDPQATAPEVTALALSLAHDVVGLI
jgi:hypothetical protein